MATSIEDRIEALLDQLEDPYLKPEQVELIEKKLGILRAQQSE